jgi:ATP-dependent DNA helicase DinG
VTSTPGEARVTLSPEAAARMRAEIDAAGGHEVCFAARVAEDGAVRDPRAVARGNPQAVLAAVGRAEAPSIILHNHPSGELTPSHADLAVASRLWEEGWGFGIVDSEVSRLYVVVEPPAPRQVRPLDPDLVDAALAPGGAFAGVHPDYEDRPQQRRFARMVAELYNRGGVGIAEAGTGTGKSIAYLLPAAAWAAENGERTVISTNTINLQEQLIRKDIPLLATALGREIEAVLVKGRANYVSIRRARLAAESAPELFEEGRQAEIGALVDWLETTEDGSLADLPVRPSGEVWDEVASDADACLGARCPHFASCFYQRARRDAASAELLVVNHHLLFSDLAVRRARGSFDAPAVLPRYSRLVLDEAHNLEEVATDHLGASLTRGGLFRTLRRLEERGRGALPGLLALLRKQGFEELADSCETIGGETVRPALAGARQRGRELFLALEQAVAASGTDLMRLGGAGGREQVEEAAESLEGMLAELRDLCRGLDELRERVRGHAEAREVAEGRMLELRAVRNRLEAAGMALRACLQPEREGGDRVRWIEQVRRASGASDVAVCAAPLDLAGMLRESLFEQLGSTLLTSATLTTRGDFGFLRGRLGLADTAVTSGGDGDGGPEEAADDGPELRLTELQVPSPFDYRVQSFLVIPTDLPLPAQRAGGGHDRATADVVLDMAGASDGGIFVLFTSYASLKAVAARLRAAGAESRWPLLVHGEADRTRLLRAFVDSGRAILLGTSSFWEGVDVPGDPLRGLVIPRLPFKVPTEPVTEARVEAIEASGGDAFRSFMLPHAALRLKQGFGRLIRSGTDHGVVAVLDGRLVTRPYGRYLLESLPPVLVRQGRWDQLAPLVHRFYRAARERAAPAHASA